MKVFLALLVFLALFLYSLGRVGQGSSSSSAPPEAATCIPLARIRVQLFGDSTMHGLDSFTHVQAVPSPATILQNEMNSRFGLGTVEVVLNAVPGTTSAQLLAGKDGVNLPWPQSVAADIVVINHGINDQDLVRGEPIKQYEINLRELVRRSPVQVVLETPNIGPGPNQRLADYAQRMRAVASSMNLPLADTYAFVQTVPNWETYFADYAHPNTEMYRRIVVGSLVPTVAPYVAKLLCK
jgi:lysophospholipase L1-like esterase